MTIHPSLPENLAIENKGVRRGVAHTLSCMYATRGVAVRPGAEDVQHRRCTAGWRRLLGLGVCDPEDFDLAMPDAEIETHLCASRGKTAYARMWRGGSGRIGHSDII